MRGRADLKESLKIIYFTVHQNSIINHHTTSALDVTKESKHTQTISNVLQATYFIGATT